MHLVGPDLARIWVRKYLNFENETSLAPGSWAGDTNNWRLIRFADVLLMYAEAVNESDGATQAPPLMLLTGYVPEPIWPLIQEWINPHYEEAIRDERG